MSPLVRAFPKLSAGKVVWHFHLLSSEHYNWQPGTCLQQQRDPRSKVKYSSQGYALNLAWRDPTARLDTLSLVPRPSGLVFVIHGAYTSGFFASDQCQGKNIQGKSLGDTLCKSIPLDYLCINRVCFKNAIRMAPCPCGHSKLLVCFKINSSSHLLVPESPQITVLNLVLRGDNIH